MVLKELQGLVLLTVALFSLLVAVWCGRASCAQRARDYVGKKEILSGLRFSYTPPFTLHERTSVQWNTKETVRPKIFPNFMSLKRCDLSPAERHCLSTISFKMQAPGKVQARGPVQAGSRSEEADLGSGILAGRL